MFGEVEHEQMRLNEAGRMIERWGGELTSKFPSVETDEYVVMPNHIHGIVVIVGADLRVRPDPGAPMIEGTHTGVPLPRIVQWFKTMTTNEYIRGVKRYGWAPFQGRLWQRNYYEHVIRNEEDLEDIRQYIVGNPAQWPEDVENPDLWERSTT